jgi:flagellar hook-length control protein FliK
MNGLATLLASPGGTPMVMGMAGRPPDSAETQTDGNGFLGVLQQLMIAGTVQTASLMSILPVLTAQQPLTEGASAHPAAAAGAITAAAIGSVSTEKPDVLSLLSPTPPGPAAKADTEVVSLVPTPTVPQPGVVELLTPPGSTPQVDAPQQQASGVATQQPATGGIPLPVPLVPVTEQLDPVIADLIGQPPVVTPLPHQETARGADDTPPEHGEKSAPVPGKTAQPSAPKKSLTAGKLAEALSLPAAGGDDDPAPKEADRRNGPAPATARKEEVKNADAGIRVPAVPATAARENASVERDNGGKPQQAQVVKPAQVKAEMKEESATPAPVKTEDVPARAVVSVKAVADAELHDGETAKNPFQHTQTQYAPVKLDTVRSTETTSRLTEFLSSLPAETARNVVDQVVKEAAMQVRGETSEMRIKLVPATLGEVTINVRMDHGQLQAQIDVSHAGVKAALDNNIGQLRDALSSRGIDVQQLDVHFGGQSMAQDAGGDQSDRYRRQGGKRHGAVDAIDQFDTGRMLGYNTMEMVM